MITTAGVNTTSMCVCVISKCDTPFEVHSREKKQGNLSQSHLLAESKKKR